MNVSVFRLDYQVSDAGWAKCRVAFGTEVADMTVSYLHDSLHQLCDVVASIATGASRGTVVFMDEPGEHELQLERFGDSQIAVRVVWFDDWKSWGFCSESDGRLVLRGETTVAHVRGQVYSAARHILESLGPEEYRRRWSRHDFPQASYERLRDAG